MHALWFRLKCCKLDMICHIPLLYTRLPERRRPLPHTYSALEYVKLERAALSFTAHDGTPSIATETRKKHYPRHARYALRCALRSVAEQGVDKSASQARITIITSKTHNYKSGPCQRAEFILAAPESVQTRTCRLDDSAFLERNVVKVLRRTELVVCDARWW